MNRAGETRSCAAVDKLPESTGDKLPESTGEEDSTLSGKLLNGTGGMAPLDVWYFAGVQS